LCSPLQREVAKSLFYPLVNDFAVALVWKFIIEPARIVLWFNGTKVVTTWQVGSPIGFIGVMNGKQYNDRGTVLQFEAEHLLQYNHWSKVSRLKDSLENRSVVTITLESNPVGTTLHLRHEHLAFSGHERLIQEATFKHWDFSWAVMLNVLKEEIEEES
jgi:uncharacterized protein YndB with AHSA1/START domain